MNAGPINLIGRENELTALETCLSLGRHVLIEGPVGVGKTHLASYSAQKLNREMIRVDGDSRMTEQKLVGTFDPSLVLKHGYKKEEFIKGPLLEAMENGAILFLNELNRLSESLQNVLLPALDERQILVPRYGTVKAKSGFVLIATQNPKEFVATSHLSEALIDRCERILMDYPGMSEELAIVLESAERAFDSSQSLKKIARAAVHFVRLTRQDTAFKRGASIRTAQALCEVTAALVESGALFKDAFLQAATITVPHRVEITREALDQSSWKAILEELCEKAIKDEAPDLSEPAKKKI